MSEAGRQLEAWPSAQAPAWGSWFWPALVGVQAMALAWWTRCSLVVDFDEAHQLAQSWGIALGARLYQDLWEFAAPLPLWAMAALFAQTGPSVNVARDVAALWMALLVILAYALGRRMSLRPAWAALAASGLAWCGLAMTHFLYHQLWAWLAMALAMLAAHGALRPGPVGRQGLALALAAGLALGLAGLSTAPVGLLGFLALLVAWFWGHWGGAWGKREAWALLALLVVGLALPWCLAWAYLAWQGAGEALWLQVWRWPWLHYKVRGSANDIRPLTDVPEWLYTFAREPMPYPLWLNRWGARVGGAMLCLALPVGVGAWALRALWLAIRGPTPTWRLVPPAVVAQALVAGGSALVALRGRADLAHLLVATLPAWPLLALGAQRLWDVAAPSWEARWGQRLPALFLVGVVLASGLEGGRQWRQERLEGRLAWDLDGHLRQSPVMRALKPYAGKSLVAFPGFGLAVLLGEMHPATRFNFLTLRRWGYHTDQEYRDFAADWRKNPPDVVLLMGLTAPQAMDQWGGVPSLKGYRFLGAFAGPFRRESWDMDLWVRDPQAP